MISKALPAELFRIEIDSTIINLRIVWSTAQIMHNAVH